MADQQLGLEAAMTICFEEAIELAGQVGDYRPLYQWAKRAEADARAGWADEPYRRDLLRIADRAALIADVAEVLTAA